MEKKLRVNSGITLIALVITIIVLLILAGISISMLTGDNGILNKAAIAAERTRYGNAKEKVKIAELASRGENGRLDKDSLKENLNKIEGIDPKVSTVEFPLTVTVDGYDFIINEDETIEEVGKTGDDGDTGDDDGIDWNKKKQEAEEEGAPDEQDDENDDLGIDANGDVINLDLWDYYLDSNNVLHIGNFNSCENGNCYKPFRQNHNLEVDNLVLPRSIKISGVWRNVESLDSYALYGFTKLKGVTISDTVKEINYKTFGYCSNLTRIDIPDSVTKLDVGAFEYCENLATVKFGSSLDASAFDGFVEDNPTSVEHIYIDSSSIVNDLYNNSVELYNGHCIEYLYIKSNLYDSSITYFADYGNGSKDIIYNFDSISQPDGYAKYKLNVIYKN